MNVRFFAVAMVVVFSLLSNRAGICDDHEVLDDLKGESCSDGNCFGYAMASAFGLENPERYSYSGIWSQYFYSVSFDSSNLQSNDIIEFTGTHAAIVTQTSTPIHVSHKKGSGAPYSASLAEVLGTYPDIDCTWRKRTWNVSVENNINGCDYYGQVLLGSVTQNSPATYHPIGGAENVTIKTLVSENDEFAGYRQEFQFFRRNGSMQATFDETEFTNSIIWQNGNDYRCCEYIARFAQIFEVELRNQFTGVGCAGNIEVKGVTRSAPYTADVREEHDITVKALYNAYDGILYCFDHWNGGSTNAQRTITPSDHETHTAYFTGKPVPVTMTRCGGSPGDYVTLEWDEHTNSNVSQYQIWRKVKGQPPDIDLLQTVNRGVTSYTDTEYRVTSGYTDDLLYYDVRAYYSTESSYADASWSAVFGSEELLQKMNPEYADKSSGMISDFALSCGPNPFNPQVTFRLDVPRRADVDIHIFNIRGRAVYSVTGGSMSPGRHLFMWNGMSTGGVQVPSGTYIVRITAAEHGSGGSHVMTDKIIKSG